MSRLAGKVVIVTGGAHGIGAAIVRRFVAEDAQVVIADINWQAGVAQATATGAQFHHVDLSDHEAVGALVESVVADHGGLDVVVSNACIHRAATAEETTPAIWNDVLNVNLTSAYSLVHFATPHLRRRPMASIVIMSSVQALVGFRGFAAYAASKGGLLALMRQLAVDLSPHIRVNAISPGTIRSYPEMLDAASERQWAALHLLNRIGECDEVAGAALFLASDDASFITGHNLVVDGGLTAQGERAI